MRPGQSPGRYIVIMGPEGIIRQPWGSPSAGIVRPQLGVGRLKFVRVG